MEKFLIQSEDDNVDDFDDEAMMRVDDALAAAFRARKRSSTVKKDRRGFVASNYMQFYYHCLCRFSKPVDGLSTEVLEVFFCCCEYQCSLFLFFF